MNPQNAPRVQRQDATGRNAGIAIVRKNQINIKTRDAETVRDAP